MDDFPGLLARDFGFKPQGKSAPMAPSRNSNINSSSGFSSVNFGLGSGGAVNSRYSSAPSKSAPIFDDHDRDGGSDDLLFNDVFGGPPKYSESRGGSGGGGTTSSSSAFDYDSIFKGNNSKASSLPVFDKPLYDDDPFDGLPGVKTTSSGSHSGKFENVFATVGSPASPKHKSPNNSSPFDDLLGSLGKKETQSKREGSKPEAETAAFDGLLYDFGRSSSPSISRSTSESSRSQKPSANSGKTASSVTEDPFVVLESTSTPAASSGGMYTDPLEEIGRFSNSGSTKVDTSSSPNMGAFDDINAFDNLGKSVPPVAAGINKKGNDRVPSQTGSSRGDTYFPASKDPVDKYPVDEAEGSTRKVPYEDFQEPHILFDMPSATTDIHRSTRKNFSSPPYADPSPRDANSPPRSEDISESSHDIWLTVSEVPLYTQPTSAPPPSRPPPPRPPRTRKVNEYSFSNSTLSSQSPRTSHAARGSAPTQIDELEDFARGGSQTSTNEHVDVHYGEDVDMDASSAEASAAAMKEAMDKAEAKFKQMREREYMKAARSRDAGQPDRDVLEAQRREQLERQARSDRERRQVEQEEEEREHRRIERESREIEREREEKEREQRRLERERERAREEREKARQAVERATREARERAALEARQRAERAAVEKASAEARERAERAAVQRALAEARERAAAEARERANAQARERDARERAAAAARAESDARQRSERAAVERAAAEARERAAAGARANQQKNENDFDSFFGSRSSSAPRPRANSSDPFFDTQNKGGSETATRSSVGTTSNMKKASSTTNIVDDLSSIFGQAPGTAGEFQEVEGETEERRKARLERHQRTQERAAKALAEKNQRDLQAQREQAERHRIAETLDAEIKRWAAGKEGNLRALLSTLQYVLWPECGWQPVSLTDLITGASVKKFYRKATLCIHPDKVQQKGANLQQKYIAEKVFDLLKEAWNKFNSEELF